MSISAPLRIKVKQAGNTVGYFEVLEFLSGATVVKDGPVAKVTVSGGGGGDADSLGGHPASYYGTRQRVEALEADVAALEVDVDAIMALIGRSAVWASLLGVAVQQDPPASGITYAEWVAGGTGAFAWLQLP